jgi:hypothetical protein
MHGRCRQRWLDGGWEVGTSQLEILQVQHLYTGNVILASVSKVLQNDCVPSHHVYWRVCTVAQLVCGKTTRRKLTKLLRELKKAGSSSSSLGILVCARAQLNLAYSRPGRGLLCRATGTSHLRNRCYSHRMLATTDTPTVATRT